MYEYHEIANIFPMMNDDEYRSLSEDIAKNGLINPIVLYEGKILDGRNRYKTCNEIGVIPKYITYEGDSPLAYVISLNLQRRHLTSSQRAMLALKVLPMLEAEARKRQATHKEGDIYLVEKFPQAEEDNKSRDLAADMFQTNAHYVSDAKKIKEEKPELIEKIVAGEMTIQEAKKKIKKDANDKARKSMAEAGALIPSSDKWHVYQDDIRTWKSQHQYDFIITDPPYPKEFLPLWEILAERANEWLKPGGLLIAMSGQSYLDDIYAMMSRHLNYYWTAAYLTLGQPTPLRQVNVNSTWKPLLIFSKGKYNGKIFGDVFKSDGKDKSFHKWGQSASGMLSIISGVCLPGQYVLDPFCGAGTTGVAALLSGCLFDGVELDREYANISSLRLSEVQAHYDA